MPTWRARTPPNARDAVVAVVAALGGPPLISALLRLGGAHLDIAERAIVGDAVPALAAAFLLTRWRWWQRVGWRPPIWRDLWLLWLPVVFLVLSMIQGARYLRDASVPALAAAVVAALLVGFTEETWLRGLLLEALRTRGARVAAFGTALLFAALHLANVRVFSLSAVVTQSLGAFALGLMFAAARIRIGSLIPLVVIHAAFDVAYLTGDGPEPSPISEGRARFLVVLIAISAVYALVLTRRSKTQDVSEVVPTLG